MAGPIGWAIGGVALTASGLFLSNRNYAIAENAVHETKKIFTDVAVLHAARAEINRLINLTERHVDGISYLLVQTKQWAPRDYAIFNPTQKEWLGALINHVHSLSQLLNMKVQA